MESYLSFADGQCLDGDTNTQLVQNLKDDMLHNVFRAQFKGVYFFSFTARVSSTRDSFALTSVLEIIKNGQVVSAGVFNSGLVEIGKYPVEVKAMLILNPGDQVTTRNYTRAADGTIAMGQLIMDDFQDKALRLDASHGNFNGFQLSSLN